MANAELAALIKAHGTGKLLAAARTILKKQHELSVCSAQSYL